MQAILATEERIRWSDDAADGFEAVELARTLRPDVVALDLNMPVMDGFEAAAALEQLEQPPAVFILTGSSSPQDIDRARRVGVKGYVTKDSIAASLVEAILAAAGLDDRAATFPGRDARCSRRLPRTRFRRAR